MDEVVKNEERLCDYCHELPASRDGPVGKRVCDACGEVSDLAGDYVDSLFTPDVMERIFRG